MMGDLLSSLILTAVWSMRPTIAEVTNDEHDLNLVAKYTRGEYDGLDFEAFGMSESDLYAHRLDISGT